MARSPQMVNAGVRGGNFFLSLILVPLQAREFGPVDYAAIVLATSVFAIVGLVDFGFAFSLQQDAATPEPSERQRVRGLMVDVVFVQTLLAIAGMSAAVVFILNQQRIGLTFASNRGQTTFALALAWQLFTIPGQSYWRWLLGMGHSSRASVIGNSQTIFVLLFTVATQLSGLKGVPRDFFLCAGYGSPGILALLDVTVRHRGEMRPGVLGRLRGYLRRSIGWTPLALINAICQQIPVLVISSRYSAAAVAWYSIGTKLFNYPLSIAQIVYFDYWPRLRRELTSDNSAAVHRSVRRSALGLLLASSAFLVFAITCSATIFRIWHVPPEMVPDRIALLGLGMIFIFTTISIPITSALSALEVKLGQSLLLLASSVATLIIGIWAQGVSTFLLLCGLVGLLAIPAWWAAFSQNLEKFKRSYS